MLTDDLQALASLAGRTVVASASTDTWEACRRGFARLLGRGDPKQEQTVELRLEQTHERLAESAGADREEARATLAEQWAARLADLLEEEPDAEPDLRALIQEIEANLPDGMVSAADHRGVSAGRDINITASAGGVAAGVIHGNVTQGSVMLGPGSVMADRGGVAVGRVEYLRPGVTGQPVSLQPRPTLEGREGLLAELHTHLTEGSGPGPRILTLHGIGGVGKTSVAVEYAHRHLATAGVLWQFPADEPAVLAAEFARLAARLAGADSLQLRDPVAVVHEVLAASTSPWLLVFDNAPDRATVQPFLPPAGNGQVLITSQSALWPPGQALEVPVLNLDAAVHFLVMRTRDSDRLAATELAQELGRLPLALEQAAAYIDATGRTLADYLANFRMHRAELLARGEPAGYTKTVATTWALAFGRLEQTSPSATGLLRLLACCAPEPVPLRLLLQPHQELIGMFGPDIASVLLELLEDPLAADDAVAALRRYSLVTPLSFGYGMCLRQVRIGGPGVS